MPKQETTFQPMFGAASTASAPAQKPEPGPAAEGQVEAGPQVELVQNKGRVERIIVTCTCCKRIELQCQY